MKRNAVDSSLIELIVILAIIGILIALLLPAASHSGKDDWVHGPSSQHPGIVNHLMGDGAVLSIADTIDPAVYMFLTTRAGGEVVGDF